MSNLHANLFEICVCFLKPRRSHNTAHNIHIEKHMGESLKIIDSYMVSFIKTLETNHLY